MTMPRGADTKPNRRWAFVRLYPRLSGVYLVQWLARWEKHLPNKSQIPSGLPWWPATRARLGNLGGVADR